ncbi:hypothetical protein ACQKEM_03595 [Pseudomonas sp. NPDC077382]
MEKSPASVFENAAVVVLPDDFAAIAAAAPDPTAAMRQGVRRACYQIFSKHDGGRVAADDNESGE